MPDWNAQLAPWLAGAADRLRTAGALLDGVPRWLLCLMIALALVGWWRSRVQARRLAGELARRAGEVETLRTLNEREKMWREASAASSPPTPNPVAQPPSPAPTAPPQQAKARAAITAGFGWPR